MRFPQQGNMDTKNVSRDTEKELYVTHTEGNLFLCPQANLPLVCPSHHFSK